MNFYLTFLLLFLSCIPFCQEVSAQQSQVRGTLTDQQQLPIEFASVSLLKSSDSSLVTGVISDSAGKFAVPIQEAGNYFLSYKVLGFVTRYSQSFSVRKGQQLDLGSTILSTDGKMLEEVSVTGSSMGNIHKIDKQSYKASQFQSAQGGTALDVLKNTPSVSVNAEGEVSLRGATGFLVLVNGKPVYSDYRDILSQIPANTVERIEIATAPSAKYDPDGKAGIVNIITKQAVKQGASATVNVQGGLPSLHTYNNLHHPVRFGGDATLYFKNKKWDFSLSGNYLRNDIAGRRVGDVNTTINNVYTSFPSDGERSFIRYNYTGRAVASYTANKNNNFSAGIYKGVRYQKRRADLLYHNSRSNVVTGEEIGSLTYFNSNLVEKTNDITLGNLDYTHAFANASSLTISGLYEHANLHGFTQNLNLGYPDKTHMLQYTINPSSNPLDAYRFRADYGVQIDSGKLELGYQYRSQLQKGDFQYLEQNLQTGDFVVNPEFSSTTRLTNRIHSFYAQYGGKRKALEYNAGLRFEHAYRQFIAGTSDPRYLRLSNLFPTLSLLYNIKSNFRAKAGYSRRVQRSTANELNPFPEREHSETLERGDANILPEFIDLAELGIVKDFKVGNVFATLYHQRIQNIVNRVNSVYNDTILNRIFTNAGLAKLWGAEAGATLKLVKRWALYFGGNVYSYSIKGALFNNEVQVNTSNVVFSFNANTSVKLSKTLTLQGNVNYVSAKVTAQGKDSYLLLPNASLKKTFLDGRLSTTLQWQNIDLGMLGSNKQRISTWGKNFYTTTNYIQETDIFLVQASFNLNQLNKKSKLPNSEFGEKEF